MTINYNHILVKFNLTDCLFTIVKVKKISFQYLQGTFLFFLTLTTLLFRNVLNYEFRSRNGWFTLKRHKLKRHKLKRHKLKRHKLKCHWDQIVDIHFFFIFVHNKSFRKILPNFNLLRTLQLTFFGPLFPRIYVRH